MTEHLSGNRFPCRISLSRRGSVLAAPPVRHGQVRHRRTGPGDGIAPTHSMCTDRHPVPRGCFDDYLGGRSDRLGLELMFDLRRPVPTQRPLASALALTAPLAIRDVLIQVRRRCPDLVWLYPGDPTQAQEIAFRIIDTGVETILIDSDEDDFLSADPDWR